MTVFYVLNIVCHTISVLVICSILFTWLLMFFKKETILNRLYGGSYNTQSGYNNRITHHAVTLIIVVPFIIDMFSMGFNTPTDYIGMSVIVLCVLFAIYFVIYVGVGLITLFSSIRSKIKPT